MKDVGDRNQPAERQPTGRLTAVPPATETIPLGGADGADPRAMDRWVLKVRGSRNPVRSDRAYAAVFDEERSAAGELTPVATVFLTNRECPFHCLMCDLWKNTLTRSVLSGEIPAQIERALAGLPPARQVKLYNSGSFFDPNAIPPGDYPAIAALLRPFEHTIVECHPAFVGQRVDAFRRELNSTLEVAIGLETAHPEVLKKLNKRMTRESFARAADYLLRRDVPVRVFILLRPPFLDEEEGLEWACRSLDFAFDCGASVCTVIPTRRGSGALERLADQGHFESPRLESLVRAVEYGIGAGRGRVFADLWDVEQFKRCPACFDSLVARLEFMNRFQRLPGLAALPAPCRVCGGE